LAGKEGDKIAVGAKLLVIDTAGEVAAVEAETQAPSPAPAGEGAVTRVLPSHARIGANFR
jgi:pyruvate/2-oxoglutarate dehydrogenase complex dihydrolipoamide acyltransferase (E2) component